MQTLCREHIASWWPDRNNDSSAGRTPSGVDILHEWSTSTLRVMQQRSQEETEAGRRYTRYPQRPILASTAPQLGWVDRGYLPSTPTAPRINSQGRVIDDHHPGRPTREGSAWMTDLLSLATPSHTISSKPSAGGADSPFCFRESSGFVSPQRVYIPHPEAVHNTCSGVRSSWVRGDPSSTRNPGL